MSNTVTDVPERNSTTAEQYASGKKLLVITHNYSNFTKGQIDAIADTFEEILVLVRYNRVTDLSGILEWDTLKKYGRDFKIADSAPENVEIVPLALTYAPIEQWYKRLGKHHYWATKAKLRGRIESFDIIHAHFSWTAGYVATRLGEEFGLSTVLTVHENEDRLREELQSGNEELYWTWRNVDAIIRVNEKDCETLSEFNESVYAIPNGYDRDRLPLKKAANAREEIGISEGAKIVFSLGGLIPRKRFKLLIRAISAVEHDEPIVCAIGGRGKERKKLERLARRYSDGSVEIRVLGFISDEELANWLNACDIFALASESEGNPTVMFEALGCGKPYVGTNVGGVSEIITSDEYGLLCQPNDENALVEVLQKGLSKTWQRETILEYGTRYTWNEIAEEVYDVYRYVEK
ncbi:glycosyltransferase family 4 protein [Natrarchaeobius halalkaliphilus]|uniref:Glycosyltransferase family 4 protein n=1 Tax=Natrarchaeobius halalkaliphilus TaxID=1679091 RepID=A0A3N6NX64_9EURY|nr:glycosyltransferase [Natrarchaeobius halalkaliphilus]RQG89219.1 glycosyltransferase family 4 protein [Natrarchaeobius halalkaliphilus]